MKVLVYSNRKVDDLIVDASTPEKELKAYLHIFKVLDQDWQVYSCDALSKQHQVLYDAAKKGDGEAAKKLINARRNYEYESVYPNEVVEV